MKIHANYVDILNRSIFPAEVIFEDGVIASIKKLPHEVSNFIIPGFIDAHIHIESSMLVPSEFAKIAVVHGTVATISDPHEIANVLGVEGVHFMIENGKQVPLKFHFGAPSCVPATNFETAGAVIDAEAIRELLSHPDIYYLAEMMNYPGVLMKDEEVLKKIQYAKEAKKPIDGHAPGMTGEKLTQYIAEGITTDHEAFSYEEALEKLQKGMKIIIREGSAAKNFEALVGLIPEYYQHMMFCSDDKHPDDLLEGHINQLCARAVGKGMDVFQVLQMACINPVEHYNLDVGQLQIGDFADCVVVKDLMHFEVLETYINGTLVASKGASFVPSVPFSTPNAFSVVPKKISDFEITSASDDINVIKAIDGALVTESIEMPATYKEGNLIANTTLDVLKITVVNRYQNTSPSIAFIHGFGLKEGAIASSVGHDSHNIIAVGVEDHLLCKAVNTIIEHKGGICVVTDQETHCLPLPVAGIMSDASAEEVGVSYAALDQLAKQLGSTLRAPFMTLSFMALLVIPSLKISDLGLFDGEQFRFTSLEIK